MAEVDVVDMEVKYATLAQRLMAYNIDMVVLLLSIVLISLFIKSNLALSIIALLVICLYHAFMESSKYKATLGKLYGHLSVVNAEGKQITFFQALFRVLFKFPSLILAFSGFFIIYFRKDRRGLHDIIVKTFVVCN